MWIVTTRGFLSVVSNRDERTPEDALLARSRARIYQRVWSVLLDLGSR